jgi:MarR family 2-MHQ and catechol resistance regulon transcriptional repressor
MSTSARVEAPRLWIVLSRCYRKVSHIAESSVAEAGLCLSDFAALEALMHKGPLTITEIQAKVLLASGSMTAAVDRLESKGLVTRRATPSDRRAKVLELTKEGKRVVEAAFRRHAAELEAAMAVLNDTERLQLHGLLKKLGLFAAEAHGDTSKGSLTTIRKGRFRNDK